MNFGGTGMAPPFAPSYQNYVSFRTFTREGDYLRTTGQRLRVAKKLLFDP